MPLPPAPSLEHFPLRSTDKLRFSDTDRQGHVNNVVFAAFFETGRCELLFDEANPLGDEGAVFVIASLKLDFRAEVHWPGSVDIGTRIVAIGRSSFTIEQVVYQGETCVASGESVIVQMDERSRKARPLRAAAVARLGTLADLRG